MGTEQSDTLGQKMVQRTPSLVTVNGQYIKELSFTNPLAPDSFAPLLERPEIEVVIMLNARTLPDDEYEITLQIKADVNAGKSTLFNIKLSYAGLFTFTQVTEEQKETILLIDCPTILFPQARKIISEVTKDSGYEPLILDSMNFSELYWQNKTQNGTATYSAYSRSLH